MTSEITYNGQLRTTAVHLKSNNEVITDAPTDNQGKGEAFSPTDLVATALASCMLTIMGIKADSLGIDIKNTKATVLKTMESNPRRISRVDIDIYFPKNEWDSDTKHSLEVSALHCPVAKSLSEHLNQAVHFHYS